MAVASQSAPSSVWNSKEPQVATERASDGERVAVEHPFDEGGAQQLEPDDDRDEHAEALQVEPPEAGDGAQGARSAMAEVRWTSCHR